MTETRDYDKSATPSAHKTSHQHDGTDEITVQDLAGELADNQKSTWAKVSGKPATFAPSAHKTSHQHDGSDEITVQDLAGELADNQKSTWAKVSGKPATLITATAVITDNRLISGDGGSRGVQERSIIVSDDGEMTNPSQPAFNAYVSTNQENKTGDGTNYYITGAFWTEHFDQGNNFSNGTFTAPVTGRYQFSGSIYLSGLLAAHNGAAGYLITSNANYPLVNLNPYAISYIGYLILSYSLAVDMDKDDTACLFIAVLNGTKVVDILKPNTQFSGFLIC